MVTIVLFSLLAGALIGARLRVLALVPAILAAWTMAIGAHMLAVGTGAIGLEMLAIGVGLQAGYLVGATLRHAVADGRQRAA